MITAGRVAAVLILAVSLPIQWLIYVVIWGLGAEPPQIWFESILWLGLPTILLVGLAALPGGRRHAVLWLGCAAALHMLMYGLTWMLCCVPSRHPVEDDPLDWIFMHPDPSGAVLTVAGAALLAGTILWSGRVRRSRRQ